MAVTAWRTVGVFISSTFRDMQAERDHLVRFVFPRLREELLKRRIHLVDVDLRWGVTSEQDALEVCREIIDECRPRFICILGGRYGWVPPGREHSITADEVSYGVLARLDVKEYRYFYFRKEEATNSIPEEAARAGGYIETDPASARKLADLKEAIAHARFQPFIYPAQWEAGTQRLVGLEGFGNRVHDDLLASIDDEYGVEPPEALDEFAEEDAAMEAFVEERVQRYVIGSRQSVFDELTRFAQADGEPNTVALTGPSGCGKSALLGRFSQDYAREHPGDLVITHFVGASAGSTDLRRALRRLCHALAQAAGDEREIPQDVKELVSRFEELLGQAAPRQRVTLILDALNQLDATDNAHTMHWLPRSLPPSVRVIVSSLEHPALEGLRRRGPAAREIALQPLSDADSRRIIEAVLKRYHKRMSEVQIAALLDKRESGNPLYLLAALEELRTLGTYEEITNRIRELPGEAQPLFLWIIRRLEADPGFRDAEGRPVGPEVVRQFASCLGVSRHGLSQMELAELIAPGDGQTDPQGNVAALIRLLRPYLMLRGELLDFYHAQLREAVQARYLQRDRGRLAVHHQLARYFRRKADPGGDSTWRGNYSRGLSELPYHQTKAQMWAEVEATLTDLLFVEAKCTARMTYELLADYVAAQSADLATEVRDAIRPVAQFVRARSHVLLRRPDLTLQEAYNLAASGPVPEQAARLLYDAARPRRPWLRLVNRPAQPAHAQSRVLEGHGWWVSALAFAQDGRLAVSRGGAAASLSDSLKVWDLPTGRCLRTIGAERMSHAMVTLLAVTPDGQRAVTADEGSVLQVWDLETGELLRELHDHGSSVEALALTPDGVTAVTGNVEGAIRLWCIESGQCLRVWEGHADTVVSMSVACDGSRMMTGCRDGTIGVWDLTTGEKLRELNTRRTGNRAVAAMPDGTRVAACTDNVFEIWDWETASQICRVELEFPWSTLTISSDGTRGLGTTLGGHVAVWDLETGEGQLIVEWSADVVSAAAMSPDGRRVLTGWDSGTIVLWEEGREAAAAPVGYPPSGVRALCVTPDGQHAVSGTAGALRVWSLGSGQETCAMESSGLWGAGAIAATPDGRRIVTGSWDGVAKAWDVWSGECLHVLGEEPDPVFAVGVTPDGRTALIGGSELVLCDLGTGACLRRLAGHVDSVLALAVSPDGNRAVTGGEDRTIRVWDLSSGECRMVLEGHAGPVMAVAVTPDGRQVVSGGIDATLRVWDLGTGECRAALEATSACRVMVVTPDGRYVVSADETRVTATAWDLRSFEPLCVFVGHTGGIKTMATVPDGKHVVSGGKDGTVRVWDLSTGEEVACFITDGQIEACVVAPDCVTVIAGDRRGRLYLLARADDDLTLTLSTPWHSSLDNTQAFGCILCRVWSEVPASALGTELPCPNCGMTVKLNPFVIEADWRPVAAAWRGE